MTVTPGIYIEAQEIPQPPFAKTSVPFNPRSLIQIEAHDDDVNAVAFADDSSQILFSGGDDGLVKVWDRRMLSEARPREVGTLAGHSDGITFIDPRVG